MPVSKSEVLHLNTTLSNLTPPEILEWSTLNLGLVFQTTSFGPSGMVILDMFSRLKPTISVPLIFIDTLYHFPETLELSEVARKRYDVHVHVYRPLGVDSPAGFEAKHGEEAWKVKDSVYDYHAKVEPSMRAFCELGVECVVTGRRASQGDARDELPVLEVDEGRGVWKVNPLAKWTESIVWDYIRAHNVLLPLLTPLTLSILTHSLVWTKPRCRRIPSTLKVTAR